MRSLIIYQITQQLLQTMRELGQIPNEQPKWILLDGDLVRTCVLWVVCTRIRTCG